MLRGPKDNWTELVKAKREMWPDSSKEKIESVKIRSKRIRDSSIES